MDRPSEPENAAPSLDSQEAKSIPTRYRWWHFSSLLSEVLAYVFLFLALSGDGHHRNYIDLAGFRFGGIDSANSERGISCQILVANLHLLTPHLSDDCHRDLNPSIPNRYAQSMKVKVPPVLFQIVLWTYLSRKRI